MYQDSRGALRHSINPYLEIAAALGLLLGLNLLAFPDQPGWLEVRPHPAWVVVVFASARYGVLPGLVAGTASAMFYLAFKMQAGLDDGLLPFVDPALFAAVGTMLGAVGDSHLRRNLKLREELAKVTDGLKDLGHQYLISLEAQKELQRRVISETGTVSMLYDAAKRLETLDFAELYPAILEAVQRFLGVQSCSLYFVSGDGMFTLQERLPADNPVRQSLSVSEPIVQSALSSRDVATIRDISVTLTPQEVKDYPLMMCAPILGAEDSVVALITVERLPFLRMTNSAARMLRVIADWSGLAMKNAEWFQRTKDRNIDDDIIGAYNYGYITKRLNEEIGRALRYRLPLSIALFKIDRFDEIASDMVPKIMRVLSFVFHRMLRKTDIVGRYEGSSTFLILLTNTDLYGAVVLAQRIVREVESYGFLPYADDSGLKLGVGLASVHESVADASSLIAVAVSTLENDSRLPVALAED